MIKRGLYFFMLTFVVCSCIFSEKKNDSLDSYTPITPVAIHHTSKMQFIDSKICKECHAEIVETHVKTAHYTTFQLANKSNIKGSFSEGENELVLNKDQSIKMTSEDTIFYQEAKIKGQGQPFYRAKIDMIIGSGTKGQSYIMRHQNQLFQLQASYFTPTDSWINSPGAPKKITPARPVIARCLECHTTYANHLSKNKSGNHFDKSNMVYGIDCQRCHGPTLKHIEFHRLHPDEKTGKNILTYTSLNRQQRLDACALCHSGLRKKVFKDPFNFNVGDPLESFSLPDYDENSLNDLDVHGNQYGLLIASNCFQKSNILNCTTCHDPHKKERGNAMLFNNKCKLCHDSSNTMVACTKGNLQPHETYNCISCHMPLVDSKTMKIQIPNSDEVSVKVRTHLIGIYKNLYPDN